MERGISCRIDKWLWSVRIFKTRSVAIEFCRKGRILIDSNPVKPSKEIHPNDIIEVRKPPVKYSFRVKGIPGNRVGAKLVREYLDNVTPIDELQKLDPNFMAFYGMRDRGTGRPTKKDRRDIDSIIDPAFTGFDWDDDLVED